MWFSCQGLFFSWYVKICHYDVFYTQRMASGKELENGLKILNLSVDEFEVETEKYFQLRVAQF